VSLTFGGRGIVTRTSPFSRRFEKSLALSPFTRKSSASTGRKSGSSAFGLCARSASSASNRACAAAGESWKPSDGMWQSAQARPFPPSFLSLRSLKALRPRATASHGPSSQLSFIAPFGFWSCPKPVCGLTVAIAPTKVSKQRKALTEFLDLYMFFHLSGEAEHYLFEARRYNEESRDVASPLGLVVPNCFSTFL